MSELSVVPVNVESGGGVPAQGAISRLQVEHGLASFLCQRHETAIIPQRRQTMRVIADAERGLWCRIKNRLTIFVGDAVHPAGVGFDGAIQPHGVLLNDVARRLRQAGRKTEITAGRLA